MKPTRGDAYQEVPRPVGAMARDLPPAHEIPWHKHPRFQLIFGVRGVMTVDTRDATWMVPPQRAVWMPPKTEHRVRTSGEVHMRTLYIEPAAARRMPRDCEVFEVTPLLRELILRATELPLEYDERGPALVVFERQLGGPQDQLAQQRRDFEHLAVARHAARRGRFDVERAHVHFTGGAHAMLGLRRHPHLSLIHISEPTRQA